MKLWRVEASGVRTTAAATVPLVAGQVTGHAALGLMVGLGGLYLSVTDKEGSTRASLLCATLLNGAAVLAGCLIGGRIWPSIVAMFVWAFLAGMASAYGEVVSQIGFISTLAFAVALGLAAGFEAGLREAVAFVAGGLWGVALTSVLWRFRRQTSELSETPEAGAARLGVFERFRANLTFRSIIFRHALRLAVGATIAVALYKILKMERGYWLIVTVLVIVKPVFADTRRRAAERVFGSVVGGFVAALLAASIRNVVALDLLLVAFSVLAYSHVRHNYGFFVIFLTPFVVLMIETVQPADWHIVVTRVFDTLLGGAIALTISYLLRPKSAFGW
jgi:hypothetical protein